MAGGGVESDGVTFNPIIALDCTEQCKLVSFEPASSKVVENVG